METCTRDYVMVKGERVNQTYTPCQIDRLKKFEPIKLLKNVFDDTFSRMENSGSASTTSLALVGAWVQFGCSRFRSVARRHFPSGNCIGHAFTNDVDKFIKSITNIDVVFGGSFEERESKLVGQFPSLFESDGPLLFHVTLVANQHNLCIVPRICLHLTRPVCVLTKYHMLIS